MNIDISVSPDALPSSRHEHGADSKKGNIG